MGEDYWERLRIYHQQAIRFGLAAPQPAPDFLLRLAELAERALAARGFGEETLLQPIFTRLRRRMNPAQALRAVYRHDGMPGSGAGGDGSLRIDNCQLTIVNS